MDLVTAFSQAYDRADGYPCLLGKGWGISLPEVGRRASIFASRLQKRMEEEEEYVGILLPNTPDFIISFWGVLFAEKTVIPLNFMLRPAEIACMIEDSGCRTVITSKKFAPVIHALEKEYEFSLKTLYIDEMDWERQFRNPEGIDISEITEREKAEEYPAVLLYTSGTTGPCKGVVLSHANILSNLEGCRDVLEISPGDTFLGVLPYFHSFGKTTSFLLPMLSSARIVFCDSLQPSDILEIINDFKVTIAVLVPSIFGLLLKHPYLQKIGLDSIRIAVSGGGPLPPVLETAFEKITGKPIHNGYGLTEASPVVSVNQPRARKTGSVGIPLSNVTVTIHDEEGEILPAGAIGEIYVKGDNVMKGYLGREEETRAVITENGALRTGDLGFLDSEGYLFITGRKKELIICGGENIHPLEIENVLCAHPSVEEAAVIGVPDKKRGEHPRAFVKLKDGCVASGQEMRKFCNEHIAKYKIPREFVFVSDFPRNTIGKILKRKLTEIHH